jgi:RNA polymerase sigma factor (TIGR02999 family)
MNVTAESANVTALLINWSRGNSAAGEDLADAVYAELRRIARRHLRGERASTLQPTALVHEAFLRLVDQKSVSWQNRAHFFAVAAKMMHRILIDHARRKHAAKRGAGAATVAIDESLGAAKREVDLVALDDALSALALLDARQSQIVELRFFGGLTIEETAAVINISPMTVKREWRMARAWLATQLENH